MKRLFYINMFYPYEYKGETFLETEISSMARIEQGKFKKYIAPIWADNNQKIVADFPDFEIIDFPAYSTFKKIIWCSKSLFDSVTANEIEELKKSNRLTFRNALKAICFVGQGNYYSEALTDYIKKNVSQSDEVTIYAYWMHLQAYMAVKTKKELHDNFTVRAITRCHRFDVYEYAQNGYIPCRQYILDGIDDINSISQDAINYISSRYSINKEKLTLARLGTKDYGTSLSKKVPATRLLSCSWMRPVKRNSLIFEAIKDADFPIEWVHIGDGEEYNILQDQINSNKNINVKCTLLGRMNNQEVIEYYRQNDFDVFVNVSSSEGVPVSIMEAMSFGKIVLATDVGGTKEIVYDGVNGYLLPIDLTPERLLSYIRKISNLSDRDYRKMCSNSRNIWEELSNEENNYNYFNTRLVEF